MDLSRSKWQFKSMRSITAFVLKTRWPRSFATRAIAWFSASLFVTFPVQLYALSELCSDDAMLVFDGSGSMAEMGYNGLDQPRILDAREAMRRAMPRITPTRRVGLIVYGPGQTDACDSVDLRFPPQKNAAARIISAIEGLSPAGNTPLTRAVGDAAKVLDYRRKSGVIVLVTDGKETCGGATCQLAGQLAADGKNLRIHVIGFKVRGEFFQWNSQKTDADQEPPAVARCLSDLTGGEYFLTESADELVAALHEVLACPLIGRRDKIGQNSNEAG